MDTQKPIRNFAIVAHIDHGKSTLADRLLEITGTIDPRVMINQILDSNPIERERGITIKLAPVRMIYKYRNPKHEIRNNSDMLKDSSTLLGMTEEQYILNLIDTPGHVDFSYEVSRSLSACEGIILVVDATSGIQAQTVAHMQLIKSKNLKVIPVINKIDLPTAKIEEVKQALVTTFHFNPEEIINISAKENLHIDKVLEAIVKRIPPPDGDPHNHLRALVFSSIYDVHKGVIVYIRVVDGEVSRATFPLKFYASKTSFSPVAVGIFKPTMQTVEKLSAGEVGFVATGLKDISLARIGDTLYLATESDIVPLPGYKEPKPMVFLSIFPTENDDFPLLRVSLEKLHLTDSSFTFQLHSSPALGKGFLCGFLGLLHAEIIKERLEREYGLNVIATAPTVEYRLDLKNGTTLTVHTPEDFPDPSFIEKIKEPVMYVTIYSPSETVGAVMQLAQEKLAEFVNLEYFGNQAKFTYIVPLSEMIIDFFDKLKAVSSGFASLDYESYDKRTVEAVKLDILLNRKIVDAFSQIINRVKVQTVANKLVGRLKELLPRHQFQIPIQAAIGGKIIARADIKSFRKDVTAKLYGGDQTRKDKLLEAQRKGKKRLREFGRVKIPQEVFLEVYKNK